MFWKIFVHSNSCADFGNVKRYSAEISSDQDTANEIIAHHYFKCCWPSGRSILSRCSSTFNGQCVPVSCPPGFFTASDSGNCTQCNTSRCRAGFYRGPCGPAADSKCVPCISKPSGNATFYVKDCQWACRPKCQQCTQVRVHFIIWEW